MNCCIHIFQNRSRSWVADVVPIERELKLLSFITIYSDVLEIIVQLVLCAAWAIARVVKDDLFHKISSWARFTGFVVCNFLWERSQILRHGVPQLSLRMTNYNRNAIAPAIEKRAAKLRLTQIGHPACFGEKQREWFQLRSIPQKERKL